VSEFGRAISKTSSPSSNHLVPNATTYTTPTRWADKQKGLRDNRCKPLNVWLRGAATLTSYAYESSSWSGTFSLASRGLNVMPEKEQNSTSCAPTRTKIRTYDLRTTPCFDSLPVLIREAHSRLEARSYGLR
jgi:hypothetical protein